MIVQLAKEVFFIQGLGEELITSIYQTIGYYLMPGKSGSHKNARPPIGWNIIFVLNRSERLEDGIIIGIGNLNIDDNKMVRRPGIDGGPKSRQR